MFLLSFICISLVFILFLLIVMFLFSSKSSSRGILNNFECGFSSVGGIIKQFSLSFFIVLILFVIFDFEVILLVSFISKRFYSFLSFILIYFFIIIRFLVEWYIGYIKWIR